MVALVTSIRAFFGIGAEKLWGDFSDMVRTCYSTSESNLNVFFTACNDGYARLYDLRHPLPALTLNAGKLGEFCNDALLCHPDGIPSAFLFITLILSG